MIRSTLMNGQWISPYTGTNSGQLVVDLDDRGTHYEGIACAYDDDRSLPDTFVHVKTADKQPVFQDHLLVFPLDPRTGEPNEWGNLQALFPKGVRMPTKASVALNFQADRLKVEWKTDIDTTGSAEMRRKKADAPSEYQPLPEVQSWADFKAFVTGLEHRRFIFRGQEQPLRLRTGFHRSGRADLPRFLREDIKALHQHLSLRTSHVFNLSIPDENGAFFNLVQHHGYPTPLLDWTFSPFVAAFFAYHRIRNSDAHLSPKEKVRVFIFDQQAWRERFPQMVHLAWRRPHFSVMEFIALNNERLIPQQSISTVTNIDDIESYIRSMSTEETQFLRIVDLPTMERPNVMKELSVMGITAGSLFPGFDGACEELRERFFNL